MNPYLTEVLQHPQSIKMSEGMLHIRDVEGPKKTGSMETRLEAMEQQVFKCQGMVERGLNANHMMITKFTSNHKMDAIDIGKHLSRLYDRVDQLQGQIYDPQNQNWPNNLTMAQRANSGIVRCGPNCQVQRATQSSVAPLVRVNGKRIDPTATSVVTISEGFRQRNGEK
ncbi:40S ribosomal protein S5-1 [Hordeum vulgare]|nr:40S ribosomal protein S5-1 [Hordeum vulgare]